jgi:hypothetical protein
VAPSHPRDYGQWPGCHKKYEAYSSGYCSGITPDSLFILVVRLNNIETIDAKLVIFLFLETNVDNLFKKAYYANEGERVEDRKTHNFLL